MVLEQLANRAKPADQSRTAMPNAGHVSWGREEVDNKMYGITLLRLLQRGARHCCVHIFTEARLADKNTGVWNRARGVNTLQSQQSNIR